MEKKIKYIGYYDTNANSREQRGYSIAATNKMNYICNVLNKNGFKVLIVSPSKTTSNNFYRGKKIKINNDTDLKLFPTFPRGNKLQKLLSHIIGDLMLFWYLITKIRKDETILVYHSLGLRNIVRISKRIKGFKVILEVEEIYQDVVSCSKITKWNEYKTIESADKYIFSTELLNEKVNSTNKTFSILYGTYQEEVDYKFRFGDNKIHVVYAGTFDPRKGGAYAAVAAAEYLPENYHIHIIGFGSKIQTKNIQEKIVDESMKSSATITYDGLLEGDEYIQFLQKCHIGLSTQIPGEKYNETSFPSKILSYMSNGLRVVSARIKVVERATLGEEIYYYDEQNPKSIAEAILSIDLNDSYDSKKIIRKLDNDFVKNIKELLEK
ncbi:glycosyltransferase [Psychrobacillus sp. FJAT-21963]|uniref:glycosyltransferase n=1 Tax=Psychrobacillus sp. FJAT-21963 TaxID=1712028 RepID=UPI0006FF65F1|nr:glycosyltransferase [Psychrobacillus sp. FJAT-21963]KQL33595.1 hypothetical protein AN959_16515 [Psychrobacillus sp. FJAT-21963]